MTEETRIKIYERTDIDIVKSKSGKSLTMVILKSDFKEDEKTLILNVNLAHFINDFLNTDRHSYKWNKISYI